MNLPKFVLVQYACKHTREKARKLEPKVGDLGWCMRCHKDVTIERVIEEYHLKCEGCSYGRLFGRDRWGAGAAGTRHARKRPDHPIVLYVGEEEVRRWRPELHQNFTKPLPSDGPEVPPF
jgi:hypothetical protein